MIFHPFLKANLKMPDVKSIVTFYFNPWTIDLKGGISSCKGIVTLYNLHYMFIFNIKKTVEDI